ncbi:hypothetical protein HYT18_02570 [Candidatus Microgenomates bacterium]|nr:hypothetical protein [Candidatus Microgenomates bacterium]
MWTSKIERAKQLKEELQKEVKSFFDSQPYKIDTKSDPQSKRLIYYLVKAEQVPEKIAFITGDIIQNLRSALDYLAYQLFTIGSGNGNIGRHIYFPISQDFDHYQREKIKKTEGISQQAKDIIDSVKPYKEGNINLWRISQLNNIDKHRLLVTVGSSFGSMDIGKHLQVSTTKAFPDLKVPAIPLFIKPADILFPLKVGDELFIDGPDAKPIPNMQFRFNIVLNEPGIIEGEILIETIQSMINEVESLVPKFESLIT